MGSYDETDITVLTCAEASERFLFKRVEILAQEYKVPSEWLQRVFEAAAMVQVSEEYVIDKYLKKLDLPISYELQEAHREICLEYNSR